MKFTAQLNKQFLPALGVRGGHLRRRLWWELLKPARLLKKTYRGTATKAILFSDNMVSVRTQASKMYFKIALYESTPEIMLFDSVSFI